MKQFFRSFVKGDLEFYAARLFGRLFWPPVSVAVLAHGENGDILAIEDGGYSLPGGILDAGEDLKEAARREVKEETGFDVEVTELLDVRTPSDGNRGVHIFFEAEVVGGEKNGSWEGDPLFIDKDEMQEKIWRLEHSHIHEYLFPQS